MNRREIATILISRRFENPFLEKQFIIPCVLNGIDSFTDEELNDLLDRSNSYEKFYDISVPSKTTISFSIGTNESAEQIKGDLKYCNNNINDFLLSYPRKYRLIGNKHYGEYSGNKVSVVDSDYADNLQYSIEL